MANCCSESGFCNLPRCIDELAVEAGTRDEGSSGLGPLKTGPDKMVHSAIKALQRSCMKGDSSSLRSGRSVGEARCNLHAAPGRVRRATPSLHRSYRQNGVRDLKENGIIP